MAQHDWHFTRLGDLVSIKHGWPFQSQYMTEYLSGRPIIVSIGNFEYSGGFRFGSTTLKAYIGNYPQEFILKPGDVLLVMTCQTAGGEILGIPGRIPNDDRTYLHNQRMGKVIIRDKKKVDIGFLYWLFLTAGFNRHLAATATGTKILHTAPERIESFSFLLPSLSTQRTIASILSAYDDLIENNTRRIAVLEEMARMLYEEWFVKFRFPGHEQAKMVESKLGMIPEGWRATKVKEVATIYRGRSYASKNLVQTEGLPFINLKCIEREGGFRHDGLKRYEGDYKESQTAKSGDIMMAITDVTQERRLIARAARVPRNGMPLFVFSMDLVKIVPKDEQQHNYLYSMFRFSNFPDEVKQYANGANVLHLSPERIENFDFPSPPMSLYSRFSEIHGDIYEQCDLLQSKNTALRRTRDLLLPKLISGEIDVSSWAEGDAGEMARELAAVGTMDAYSSGTGAARRVAEAGPIEPMDSSALERHSLWEDA